MSPRNKVFLNYTGSIEIGHLVVFQTGLTMTAGIVLDVADEVERPEALISEVSAEALSSIKNMADYNTFVSFDFSLIDHQLHRQQVADLKLLPIVKIPEFLAISEDVSEGITDLLELNAKFLRNL